MAQQTVANQFGVTQGQGRFAMIPRADIPRSVFDRSHGLKTTFSETYLYPILADEALPGDTMRLQVSSLVRLATPIYPLMDNMWLDFFFFAVPLRLIWDNFQRFMGEQPNPGDTTDFECPKMVETVAELSLSDYFGIPIGVTDLEFNSFWHRAYALVWREWFRDENLQDAPVVDTDDGPDDPTDYVLLPRGKRHDYFAGCLPFPQKGTAVTLPLGTSATVAISGTGDPTFDVGGHTGITFGISTVTTGGQETSVWSTTTGASGDTSATWNDPQLTGVADLTTATAATINQIREAFQIQRLLERDARGGTRYTELVRSHFGVVSPDARLQRPEYLGGGSTRISVNPVASTAYSGVRVMGSLAAFGVAAGSGIGFLKSFTEHCVILGLVNVRADITYQEGLNRMFSRTSRYDFYWPSLAHLGEQAVLNKEIYADGSANDDLTFGYQERYAEYRYKPSFTTGRMRSTSATTIDQWHLGLEFGALPELNDTFIADQPPISRVVAVASEPHFFGDFFFSIRHARPMPTYSVPGLIDHF